MNLDERLAQLRVLTQMPKPVQERDPRIVTVGSISIQGNAGSRLVGGANVTVAGSAKHGYAICSTCPGEDQGIGNALSATPFPTGACCIDNVCSTLTASACSDAGGDYQGDGTPCDPDPCAAPTGACCVDGECSIETEADCEDMSGTYQGDGSECDPNPCVPTCCESVFENEGLFYLGKHICFTYSDSADLGPPHNMCTTEVSICSSVTIDPETCEAVSSCSGSYTISDDTASDTQDWVGPTDGHCHWSSSGDSGLPAPFHCATCDPSPGGCPGVGFLEEKVVDCDSSCSGPPGNGSQTNSVRITYFNQCLPP